MTENVKSENGRVKQKYHVTTDYAWCTVCDLFHFSHKCIKIATSRFIYLETTFIFCVFKGKVLMNMSECRIRN